VSEKHILILTADAGMGHRSAAEAIKAALVELYADRCQVDVMNPLDEADAPDIIRQIEQGYDEIVVKDQVLYSLAYHALDMPVVSDLTRAVATRLLNDVIFRLVEQGRYDVIVTTYPTYARPVANALMEVERDVPVAVVITDLTDVARLWFCRSATMHFVPTNEIRKQAYKNEIPATRVRVTGLPVHPRIAGETPPPDMLRETLGWEKDLPTGLIVASARTKQMATISRFLDRSGLNLQLAVVCGGAQDMYEHLLHADWQSVVHVYNWIDNMPQLLKASDFLVTKAGGLVVSEALACGLPLIITEALPGQEAGNVRYVVDNGAGVWAPGAAEVMVTVHDWLQSDPEKFAQVRANAQSLGKPRAAFNIAEAIWGLA